VASMKISTSLSLVLMCAVATCSCSDRVVDLSDSKGFSELVGLCLRARVDLLAARISEGGYSLLPLSAKPMDVEFGEDYWVVPASSTISVDGVSSTTAFDGQFLVVYGTLHLHDSGREIEVDVTDLFDAVWFDATRTAIREGRQIAIDPNSPPLKDELIVKCPEP